MLWQQLIVLKEQSCNKDLNICNNSIIEPTSTSTLFIVVQVPALIVHYTRPWSSVKWPNQTKKLNGLLFILKVATKSWIQYQVALPINNRSFTQPSQYLRRILVATLPRSISWRSVCANRRYNTWLNLRSILNYSSCVSNQATSWIWLLDPRERYFSLSFGTICLTYTVSQYKTCMSASSGSSVPR